MGEKTEDTTDAKAAEPEAKEEEAKEKDITIDMRAKYSMKNQNPNYGEFLSTTSTSTTNINQKIKMKNYFPHPTEYKSLSNDSLPLLFPPFKILIEFVDDEITVFWA